MSEPLSLTELRNAVSSFFPKIQLKTVISNINDTEDEDWEANRDYFLGVLQTFKNTFEAMPKTYETHSKEAGEALAYLHYFVAGCDWWITEKDMEEEQLQAFGVARLNGNRPELGYISIDELINLRIKTNIGIPLHVELDFHWEPTKLKDIPALQGKFDCQPV